jgi:DNA-binding CsgD family transcriptional regulator
VPICLLLIPLFPSIPWLLLVLVALGFGFGNAVVVWLFRGDISPTRFQWTARLASALDWSGVLGMIGAFSGELEAGSPSLLLLLLGLAGLRSGLRGLIIATTGATVAVVILVEVQVRVHGVLAADRALTILVSWGLLFSVATLLLGSLLRVGEKWWSGQKTEHSSESVPSHEAQPAAMEPQVDQVDRQPMKITALQRPPCCLTKREQQLLPLLARPDLTYHDIGNQLSISPDTIKTHVYHIAQKLGVRGRWAVVTVSRERGLLGDEDGD